MVCWVLTGHAGPVILEEVPAMTTLLASDDLLMKLMERGDLIPILAIVFGCMVGMVAIVSCTIAGVVQRKSFERTRRELAAYVAEGTLDPDKAVAILNASTSKGEIDAILGRKA